jgi:hypothetical protein
VAGAVLAAGATGVDVGAVVWANAAEANRPAIMVAITFFMLVSSLCLRFEVHCIAVSLSKKRGPPLLS